MAFRLGWGSTFVTGLSSGSPFSVLDCKNMLEWSSFITYFIDTHNWGCTIACCLHEPTPLLRQCLFISCMIRALSSKQKELKLNGNLALFAELFQ